MAFTFCTNCGEQIDISLEKCPHCGHPTGAQRNYTYGMDPTSVNRQSRFDQNGQAPQNNQNQNSSDKKSEDKKGNNDDKKDSDDDDDDKEAKAQ